MDLMQDWHKTFENASTHCCSLLKTLLHLAPQNPIQLSAVALFKILAELSEKFCIKLIVVSGYNGIIDMNCENNFGYGAVGLFDFLHKRHAISVEVLESVSF